MLSADNSYRDLDNSGYHGKPNSKIFFIIHWKSQIKYKTTLKDTKPQNVLKPCADEVFHPSSLFFISLRYSSNTCLYFRWPFRVLNILICYKCFNLRSINRANYTSVFIQLWILQCELCDRAVHITKHPLWLCDRAQHTTKYPELSAAFGIEIETSMYNNT